MVREKCWPHRHADLYHMAIVYLLGIFLISSVCSGWIIRRKIEEKPVKVMMFVGYFWLLTFGQLLLFTLLYFIYQRFYA